VTTHRFQPVLDMDDEWHIVDMEEHTRTTRTFPRDTAIILCFELERDADRKGDVATWQELTPND
jgi:hypothetical protein